MQAYLDVRIFDSGDEYRMALHDLSAIDDLASTSVSDATVVGGLVAAVPNCPFSAAIVDGTYFPADETRDNDATTLRRGPYNEVTHASLHSHIALWSSEYDLREKADAGNATIPTRILFTVPTPRIVVLPFR
jgi:hypothetical protein